MTGLFRRGLRIPFGIALAAFPVTAQAAGLGTQLFADSFESVSNCAWSSGTSPVAPTIALGLTLEPVPPPPGSIAGSCLGPGGELVYVFTPTTAGILRISVTANVDIGFYVRDACPGGQELLCADSGLAGDTELGELVLADTAPLYLVLDSWENGDDFAVSLALCGNSQIEPGELCDGNDLGGQTCQSLGFSGGDLACQPSCLDFDTSGCFL